MIRRIGIVIGLIMILFINPVVADGPTLPQTIGSGQITFRGYIEAGLYFAVNPLTDESFNLLTTEELLPTGTGVDVGEWTLRVDNPPVEEVSFTIQYDYESIANTNEDITDTIEYRVLERLDDNSEAVVKTPADTTVITIDAASGLNTITRTFSVRLTEAGAESALRAAASDTYITFITVSLAAE